MVGTTQWIRCANGLCAESTSKCIDDTTGCPGQDYNQKCPNGACILAPVQTCTAVEVPSNGCPKLTPTRCPDGSCADLPASCPNKAGCTAPDVYKCSVTGACVADPSTCPQTCLPTETFICADGTCKTSPAMCATTNGCLVGTPVRCADGSCQQTSGDCPIALSCDVNEVLCYDGTCKPRVSPLGPSPCSAQSSCPVASPFLCADLTCAVDSASCAATRCPPTNPVLCADGFCKASPALCPKPKTNGGSGLGATVTSTNGADAGCPDSAPRKCFDGSCRATAIECINWKATVLANADADVSSDPAAAEALCPGRILCSDGTCVANAKWCPIITSCPVGLYRCQDGSCNAALAGCPAAKICPTGYWACEDGTCRSKCLHLNGCKSTSPYHCENRLCAATPLQCASLEDKIPRYSSRDIADAGAPPNTGNGTRRLLANGNGTKGDPCLTECNAKVQPRIQQWALDTRSTNTLKIAEGADGRVRGRLIVPSGALQTLDQSGQSTLTILPVPESRVRGAVNKVDTTRSAELGKYLGYPSTLLTSTFECVTEQNVVEPFAVNLTYTATLDIDLWGPQPAPIDYLDVCLARLVESTDSAFRRWECVHGDSLADRNNYPVHPDGSSLNFKEVTGSFHSCSTAGTVYGFVYVPREIPAPIIPIEEDWWVNNILYVLLVFVLAVAFIAAVFYTGKRLHRYRLKYHEERAAVDRMQDEVNTMEQFGGRAGNKDDEVALTDNPLVMQMADMQRKLDAKDIEMEEASIAEMEAESDIRQDHIVALKDDRNELQEELDRLKAELAQQAELRPQAATQAVGRRNNDNDDAVREDIDPVRKKKKKKKRDM